MRLSPKQGKEDSMREIGGWQQPIKTEKHDEENTTINDQGQLEWEKQDRLKKK